jgi:hypothetical protein
MFQLITSNFVSVPLTDIVAALTAALAVVGLTRLTPNASWAVREPGGPPRAGRAPPRSGEAGGPGGPAAAQGIGWSPGMLVVLATLIFLQSTPVLGWMLP